MVSITLDLVTLTIMLSGRGLLFRDKLLLLLELLAVDLFGWILCRDMAVSCHMFSGVGIVLHVVECRELLFSDC